MRRFILTKNIVLFIFAFALIFGFSQIACAQSVGIKISPIRIEDLVDPGQVLVKDVTVTNVSNSPKRFYVYLRDFKSEDETGRATLIAPGSEKGNYLASWIEVTKEAIDFAPGEQKTIPFTIRVPENTGPGGYYGAILLGTEPPRLKLDSEDKGAGMSIAQQAATLILLQISGEVNEQGEIREFNTDKDAYSTPFSVDFLLRIENLGNVHIKPHGTIKITNMFNKEVAVVQVNDKGGNILPGTIRRFDNLSWADRNGFGRYKATLGLSYGTSVDDGGQGKKSMVAEKSFWIIPWRIIIPMLLGLVFFSALMVLLLRLYKNKAVRKAMEEAGLGQVRYVKTYEGPSPALHLSLILLVVFILLFLIVMGIYFIFFA